MTTNIVFSIMLHQSSQSGKHMFASMTMWRYVLHVTNITLPPLKGNWVAFFGGFIIRGRVLRGLVSDGG